MFSMENKTVLITGATSGLGAGAAKIFADAGARVIITGRREERLKALAAEIGDKAVSIVLDVTDEESRQAMMSKIENEGLKIDVLLNNAGIGVSSEIFEENEKGAFESNFETNVFGLWHILKLVANHMKDHKIKGSIINIASIYGMHSCSSRIVGYGAAKSAVLQVTDSLCMELAEHDIRINSISPGFFRTEMTEKAIAEREKQLIHNTPLGFIAYPEQMAGTLLYLASNEASPYTTGANLVVDGGMSRLGRGNKN